MCVPFTASSQVQWVQNIMFVFSCQSGYQIAGDPRIRCENNGRWSTNLPQCVRVQTGGCPFYFQAQPNKGTFPEMRCVRVTPLHFLFAQSYEFAVLRLLLENQNNSLDFTLNFAVGCGSPPNIPFSVPDNRDYPIGQIFTYR